MTDGRTDRRTDTAKTALASHRAVKIVVIIAKRCSVLLYNEKKTIDR